MIVRRFLADVKGATEKIRYGMRKKPDVIIFGEGHVSEMDVKEQAKVIQRIKPEYVLCEGLDRSEPERFEKSLQVYKDLSTLSRISERVGINLGDAGLDHSVMKTLKEKGKEEFARNVKFYGESFKKEGYNERKARSAAEKTAKRDSREGVSPKNYKQLIQTPLYRMNISVLENLGKSVADKTEQYTNKDEFETANKAQRIHSAIVGFWHIVHLAQYDYSGQKKRTNELYHACAQAGAKLAGCDIEKEIPKTDFPADEKDPEKIAQSFENMRKSLEQYVSNNNPQREMEMGKRIAEYAAKRKTGAPIIAIVGKHHIRSDSGIYEAINNAGLSYKAIRQKSRDSGGTKSLLYGASLGMK